MAGILVFFAAIEQRRQPTGNLTRGRAREGNLTLARGLLQVGFWELELKVWKAVMSAHQSLQEHRWQDLAGLPGWALQKSLRPAGIWADCQILCTGRKLPINGHTLCKSV